MSPLRNWYLISYDVRQEGRLRKVQRLMLGYGHRLQYSVFRCRLTERDVERMKWELAEILDAEDDLLIVSLCRACVKKIAVNGPKARWPTANPNYDIV